MHRRMALIVALLLTYGACGDSGGGGEETPDQPAAGSTTTVAGTSTSVDFGSGGPLGFDDDCLFLVEVMAAGPAGLLGEPAGFEGTVELLERAAEAAPREIKSDLEILAAAFGEFADAMDAAGVDFSSQEPDPAAIQILVEAAKAMETPEVEAANDRIGEFFEQRCEP